MVTSKFAGTIAPETAEPSPQQHPRVNLVVDVQYGTVMELTDAAQEKYLQKMAETVEALRKQGIPTIWITISDRNQLYPGTASDSPQVRDDKTLTETDFFKCGPDMEAGPCAYRDFMKTHGPKTDETIFPKAFFGAFSEQKDLARMGAHLANQRRDALDLHKALAGDSLRAHLEKMGVREVSIMGGMTDVCVMETAMGAAMNGMKAVVLSDLVISRDNLDLQKPPAFSEQKLQDKLRKITDSPQDLAADQTHRAFASGTLLTADDKAAIKSGITSQTSGDYIRRVQGPAAQVKKTPCGPGLS